MRVSRVFLHALLPFLILAQPLLGQQRETNDLTERVHWVISPGIGVFTLLRLEVARETDSRLSQAFALGLHPLGVPSVEALLRRRVGEPSINGAQTSVDVAALGFLPGTQFADGTLPGLGLHVTVGRTWTRSSGRALRLRFGIAVYHEISDDPADNPETDAMPVLAFEAVGRKRR